MTSRIDRYICIHGHFYQPPRENPWLETIEPQESAHPFPNWNERILSECYRPNAAARIVDVDGRIIRIDNNYQHISFNFGPTLLSWMESAAPDVYRAILDADRLSISRFAGHGSALAQAYNHMIMPLANRRDKVTQVVWGIRDFEHRFGRLPEGMWLPETGVDGETLDVLAEHGVSFTILGPGQAHRVRRIDEVGQPLEDWCRVAGGQIETGRAYRARTPSGRHVDIFFYDGNNANAVAFERLLDNGGRFAERLAARLPASREPMLSHIATDGETYGHHHRYGDMALAFALHHIELSDALTLTNYGEFLANHPPRYEVEIINETAWSCAHGVGRWSDDCGCHMGGQPAWNQRWRKHLRVALDDLRDQLIDVFERHSDGLLQDPWVARNQYIDVILDRDRETVDRFLQSNATRPLSDDEQCTALQLLEMQRHAMLMYTSCGWFFDDFTGPEGRQILGYAARAIELSERVSDVRVESRFLDLLERAISNRADMGNGRQVYDKLVRPTLVDLRRVIAQYAISCLFESKSEVERVYCYRIRVTDLQVRHAGKAKLAVGTALCTSAITRATSTLSFGALHVGDHNLIGGAHRFEADAYQTMSEHLLEAFARADLVAVQRAIDRHFAEYTFSLESLFADERQRILDRILKIPLAEAEAAYRQLYEHHAPLMRYLVNVELPMPEAFQTAAQFILNLELRRALEAKLPPMNDIRSCLEQAEKVGVELDERDMGYLWRHTLERLAAHLVASPGDEQVLEALCLIAELVREKRIDIDLWVTQNRCYQLREQARTGADVNATPARFERLCRAVGIAV